MPEGDKALRIHKLVERQVERAEVDPVQGLIRVWRTEIRPSQEERISHDGVEYEIEADGSFEVPHELGLLLTKRHGWYEGPSPFADNPDTLKLMPKLVREKAAQAAASAKDVEAAEAKALAASAARNAAKAGKSASSDDSASGKKAEQ